MLRRTVRHGHLGTHLARPTARRRLARSAHRHAAGRPGLDPAAARRPPRHLPGGRVAPRDRPQHPVASAPSPCWPGCSAWSPTTWWRARPTRGQGDRLPLVVTRWTEVEHQLALLARDLWWLDGADGAVEAADRSVSDRVLGEWDVVLGKLAGTVRDPAEVAAVAEARADRPSASRAPMRRWASIAVCTVLLALGLGVRLHGLDDSPMQFHSTRSTALGDHRPVDLPRPDRARRRCRSHPCAPGGVVGRAARSAGHREHRGHAVPGDGRGEPLGRRRVVVGRLRCRRPPAVLDLGSVHGPRRAGHRPGPVPVPPARHQGRP